MVYFYFIHRFYFIYARSTFFGKVKLKIYKRGKQKGELELHLSFLIHKVVDIDSYFEKYMEDNSLFENLKFILKNIDTYSQMTPSIQKSLKEMRVTKITFIPNWNTENPMLFPYVTFFNWQLINIVKYILESHFKSVENEYYQVMMNDNTKRGFHLDLEIQVSLLALIKISIMNKELFHKVLMMIRKQTEEEYHGERELKKTN